MNIASNFVHDLTPTAKSQFKTPVSPKSHATSDGVLKAVT